MKILFLDFDGVLNHEAHFRLRGRQEKQMPKGLDQSRRISMICPIAASNLQTLLEEVPHLKIVISSTWREVFSLDEIKQTLDHFGVDSSRVIGKTGSHFGERRGYQRGTLIQDWLEDNGPFVDLKYAVLDDDDDMDAVRENFFRTSILDGLTLSTVVKVAYHFGVKMPHIRYM